MFVKRELRNLGCDRLVCAGWVWTERNL